MHVLFNTEDSDLGASTDARHVTLDLLKQAVGRALCSILDPAVGNERPNGQHVAGSHPRHAPHLRAGGHVVRARSCDMRPEHSHNALQPCS